MSRPGFLSLLCRLGAVGAAGAALALVFSPVQISAGAAGAAGMAEGETINAKSFFPASGFPLAEQRRLAARVLGDEWLRDAEVEEYMQRITRELVPEDEHFIVLADSGDVNAFAYLGGLVVLYGGLWNFSDEEDGLVGVVAHEIAHVKLKHVERARDNAERTSALSVPLIIAGILAEDEEVREAAFAGATGLISSEQVAYSRELEHEADVFALDTMQRAERDVGAMVRIFGRFDSSVNEYLSTHPLPARRSAYLAQRLREAPPPAPRGELDYYLLREKLARRDVLESDYRRRKRDEIAAADAATEEGARDKAVAQYGLLLSANKTRDKTLGEEMSAALAQESKVRDNPIIVRARAEALSKQGSHDEALRILQAAFVAHPDRPSLLLAQFEAQTLAGRHRQIVARYDTLSEDMQENPDVLRAVGLAAARLGRQQQSHYFLSRHYAQAGDFEQAQKQIVIAEKFKDGDAGTLLKLSELKRAVGRELELLRSGDILQTE